MIPYNKSAEKVIQYKNVQISDFLIENDSNIDTETVESFGEEWSKFSNFNPQELDNVGSEYFDIVDESINQDSSVLDVGCGTGRWTKYIARRVRFVEAIDPSKAVFSAIDLLQNEKNIRVTKASVETIPFEDDSFDLVFSLGVLHHIPDTKEAMKRCVEKVKPGGFFLVYLYYSLDNRGGLYKFIFSVSTVFRKMISKMPAGMKKIVCDVIAVLIYFPFVSLSRLFLVLGLKGIAKKIPLNYYANKSWNIIRNDALDRFGTPLEQRFSQVEIRSMMEDCGLEDIKFSSIEPYWHAIGKKK